METTTATSLTSAITATGSSVLSIETLTASQLNALPARLTSEQETVLEEFCRSRPAAPGPCGDERFAWAMRALSILPRRGDDEVKGELRYNLYRAKLRHLTEPAIIFVIDKALERCTFFPTIKELLDIAAEHQPRVDPGVALRDRARALLITSRRLRFEDAMAKLAAREMTQPEIDALPDQWKMIAVERCFLWLHPDLSFTVRADADAGRFEVDWTTFPGEAA